MTPTARTPKRDHAPHVCESRSKAAQTDQTLASATTPASQDGRNQPYPYGWRERAGRIVWRCIYLCAFRFVPRTFNWWHRLVLRAFGAEVGTGTAIWPSAEIYFPWRLTLQDYCVIGPQVKLYSLGTIVVGKHAVISQYAHLCAGTHDYTNPTMPLIRSTIHIGNGCWICTEVFVGPDVTIGDRAVVGARAVVVSDLPGDMVCAGNPCRPIKPRVMQA
jgi:putative colanic acid biosynthesis acetyltransferase WcaF